jgi:glutathione synthase/RimK-type ligase-like ATP-grasp enzyme
METAILRKAGCSYETCNGILKNIQRKNVRIFKSKEKNNGCDVLLRWGSVARFSSRFCINTPEMIHLASDKIRTRQELMDNGIPVPRTFFSLRDALKSNAFPIIGRRRQHAQGRKMVVSYNQNQLVRDKRSEYWSEFIPKDREFRVYVFFGRILGISEKIPNDPLEIAWNHSLGKGAFQNLRFKEIPREIGYLALRAADALDLDFAGIDIISKGNQTFVLETNSSCELSPYRQYLFGRAFDWVIRQIERTGNKPEHFQLPRSAKDKMILLCKN